MERRVKTIGVLRFSVLTPTYYSEKFDTLDKTAAHLFSPERMELRFRLFENLCLPSLVRQTDPDFVALVLTAESMPEPYLQRLASLVEGLPNIAVVPVGTGNHYGMLKEAYNSVPCEDCTHRILFRLDDDDAVDKNYIKRTKRLANGMLRLQGPKTPTIIAYNRGFYVRCQDGENEVFDACERAPLSTGTALVAPVDFPANPYRFVHRKLAQHYNTYSDISVPGFIRTIHGDNKSNPSVMGITHKMKPHAMARSLRDHFDVSIDDLQAL
ncbi:glycosyltransferase [Arenibacterium sp. CAU 1754]